MNCQNCGTEQEQDWRYCPRCGNSPRRGLFDLSRLFSRMQKEMATLSEDMDQEFDREIEAVDLSPFFKRSKGTGFTVRIVTGTNQEPEVEVKTFGGVDKQQLEEEIKEKLGIVTRPVKRPRTEKSRFPVPSTTEEPHTDVQSHGQRVTVDMKIPGVKHEKDVEVREYESSVEVKAIAGKKAYFKILTKPAGAHLVAQKFSKGKLHLEFA